MSKPYSYDLRQKVIQAIKLDGLKISEASLLFNISRNTINLWLKRLDITGDFQALPNQPPGNGHKITDWTKFREFALSHGDIVASPRSWWQCFPFLYIKPTKTRKDSGGGY